MRKQISDGLRWGVPALAPRTMSLLMVMLPCCSALVAASTIRYEMHRKQACARELRQAQQEIAHLSAVLGTPAPSHDDHDDHDGARD